MRFEIWMRSESIDKHITTMLAQTFHLMKIHIPFVLIATKYHTQFDPTETSTERLAVADSWQRQTTRILHYNRSPAHRPQCLIWSVTRCRHAFRREKVVLECGMRICYMVKKGALKTHFAGVMISEETTMSYRSQRTKWCGARHWWFIVERKIISLVTSHLGQCSGELVARKHVFVHVKWRFIELVDFWA